MRFFSRATFFLTGLMIGSTGLAGLASDLYIESFLTAPAAGSPVVVAIKGQGIADLTDGDVLHSGRAVLGQDGDSVRFITGRLKVNKIERGRALATILADGMESSAGMLGKFNKVMAGDLLHPVSVSFRQNIAMTPSVSMRFQDLFSDPESLPNTLELSNAGKSKLTDALSGLKGVRTRMVAVEGYVDAAGDSLTNQVESYERAMTVRQFLINDLGFDPDRIMAFGLGEQEPIDSSNLSGSAVQNRRIVVKVIPLSEGDTSSM